MLYSLPLVVGALSDFSIDYANVPLRLGYR